MPIELLSSGLKIPGQIFLCELAQTLSHLGVPGLAWARPNIDRGAHLLFQDELTQLGLDWEELKPGPDGGAVINVHTCISQIPGSGGR